VAGQFGLERTWVRHVARMRYVFRLARELLADDGVLWLNYGDCYASSGGSGWQGKHGARANRTHTQRTLKRRSALNGLKPKDMVGMPWRIALALQDDGWWLRSDVIWHKPNPMPESVADRPTKAHEYIFLLAKSADYHYDGAAIREPSTGGAHPRGDGVNPKARTGNRTVAGWADGPDHSAVGHAKSKGDEARAAQGLRDSTKFGRGKGWRKQDAGAQVSGGDRMTGFNDRYRSKQNESFSEAVAGLVDDRNARTVWTMPTEQTSFAHFATFPRELARRCILAGSRGGDIIFDPFMGSGTVAEVATSLGRRFIGCELNKDYAEMFKAHRSQQQGMAL